MSGQAISYAREWGGRLPVALVFPEDEPQALSTLGWQSVYQELGYDEGFYVERFFWNKKEQKGVSADSDKKLDLFPIVCFSLNFEGDYLNLINILRAENIPVLAEERSSWPLIMAGGPVAFLNPFPVIPSLDFLYVGEAEGRFKRVAHSIRDSWLAGDALESVLKRISGFPGILVPEMKQKVQRQIFMDQDRCLPLPAHSGFVSARSVFRDSLLVEINRGCSYGCRFCAAGFIYRPPRQARINDLKQIIRSASPRKVGLVGTALTDWEDLQEFLEWLQSLNIKFSLSSLRSDNIDQGLLAFLRRCGIRTITLAVEGVSQILRTAMNKHFSEEKFFLAVQRISELRFNTLKLYFILGLPGEKMSDLDEMSRFLARLDKARKDGMGRRSRGLDLVSISASMFVPKPWTPLQWAPMESEEEFNRKARTLKRICSEYKGLRFQAEKPFGARIQGLLSRGDEQVHELLMLAAENSNNWKRALSLWSGKIEDYIDRELPVDNEFAWDIIDMGINKKYLVREWGRYKKALPTSPCPDQPCGTCKRCGMDSFFKN